MHVCLYVLISRFPYPLNWLAQLISDKQKNTPPPLPCYFQLYENFYLVHDVLKLGPYSYNVQSMHGSYDQSGIFKIMSANTTRAVNKIWILIR